MQIINEEAERRNSAPFEAIDRYRSLSANLIKLCLELSKQK